MDIGSLIEEPKERVGEFSRSFDVDDSTFEKFVDKYERQIIEFDGSIDYFDIDLEDRNTKDYLVRTGNYSEDSQVGATFHFENVILEDYSEGIEKKRWV